MANPIKVTNVTAAANPAGADQFLILIRIKRVETGFKISVSTSAMAK
jgi:hypothetical protein